MALKEVKETCPSPKPSRPFLGVRHSIAKVLAVEKNQLIEWVYPSP
jgi:hypothetical protein